VTASALTISLGQHAERDSTEARAASAPAPGVAPTLGQDAPAPGPSTHGPSGRVGLAGAVVVEVPLVLRALGNRREHWRARARRVSRTHDAVRGALAGLEPPPLPVTVELVRVAWNRCDADGCVGAAKDVIDALAAWLGVDDRDPRLHWHLAQQVTRERRLVRGRPVAAASLRIVARRWQPSDGDDPLRVLAVAPESARRRSSGRGE
jgi:hypothetical protein